MISKELFEEIIGYNIKDLNMTKDYPDNVVWSTANYKGSSPYCKAINIHELANKCKEWALTKDYHLTSYINLIDGLKVWECNTMFDHEEIFKATSEPEAIFLACQWVLNKKDN